MPSLLTVIIELGWLLLIVAFAAVSVFPIYGTITHDLLIINGVLALLFACNFRLAVFFRQIPYLKFLVIQVPLFLLNPVLFFKVLGKMQEMFNLFDMHDLSFFIAPASHDSISRMNDAYSFFKKEFVLFSVGLLVLIVIAELRVLLAFVKRIREMD